MENIYLDGQGLGVIFNKPWKRVAIRFLFNDDQKWTSGTLHERIKEHLAPQTVSQGSITHFLQELAKHGLLEKEPRHGPGCRGGGVFYRRVTGVDGVWEYQILRMIQACVDGRGAPLMFQGSWIYPSNASDLHCLQGGKNE
jgi:hypothetical protein